MNFNSTSLHSNYSSASCLQLNLNSRIQKAFLICALKTVDKLPNPDMHVFSGTGSGKATAISQLINLTSNKCLMGEQQWPRIMWPAAAPALFLEQCSHSTTSAGTQQMLRYLPRGTHAMFTTPGPCWWIIILPRSEERASQQNQVHLLCLLILLKYTVRMLYASVWVENVSIIKSTMKLKWNGYCLA